MPPRNIVQSLLPRLFEDDQFLAVEKPAGLDVGGQEDQHGVVEILAGMRGKREEFFVVNRLSRYESGVLLLARTKEAADFVRAALKAGRVDQEYVAVVIGKMKDRRMVFGPGGAQRDSSKLAAVPRRGERTPRRGPQRGATRPVAREGSPTTTLSLLELGERRSIVSARTTAPNTHVLRAQLRSVRLRLVGDNVHDPSPKRQLNESTCLHLSRLTFHHPRLRTRVGVTSPAPSFRAAIEGGFDVERVLRAALALRLPLLLDKSTDSLRLITGAVEGLRGINAEKFADVVILYVLDEKADDRALHLRIARWYANALEIKSVYVKPFVKDRVGADETVANRLKSGKPLLGDAAPEQIEIRERNLRYWIHPYDGYSVGLFLDHRDNRARIHDSAAGSEVLNLFAYTCGFSLAAAVGGAVRTTSVDVSSKNLEWGRANFTLNHLNTEAHEFIRADAMEFLRRAKRQEKSYDLIVIDPPSFAYGRGSKKDFSIVQDLPDLIAAAAEVLRAGGGMMVSTNYRKMSLRELKELIRRGLGKRGKVVDAPRLPVDFAIDRDHAKTLFVQV